MPRRLAVIPFYNEAPGLLGVLEGALAWADHLVLVDDGSTDGSSEKARRWADGRRSKATLLRLEVNRGMSDALRAGLLAVERGLAEGSWDAGDLVVCLDADGQFRDADIPALCAGLEKGGLDVVIARRDLGLYPAYKRWGNRLLSLWAGLLCGRRFHDVESGLRALRAGAVPRLLDYFTGVRYSCAQELAIIASLTGLRVDNSTPQPVAYYRSRTRLRDVAINAAMGLGAAARVRLGWKTRRPASKFPPPQRTRPGASG